MLLITVISDNHVLDKSSRKNVDASLSDQLSVHIIEKVRTKTGDDPDTKLKKCKEREGFWQNQLRTLEAYGGLNKRDSKKETSDQSK